MTTNLLKITISARSPEGQMSREVSTISLEASAILIHRSKYRPAQHPAASYENVFLTAEHFPKFIEGCVINTGDFKSG
jgi:hypothetical protein